MTDDAPASRSQSELEPLSDWRLLEEWKAGNRRAAAVFIQRYSGLLSRFFRNKVRHREDANELVSESMMACVAGLDRVQQQGSFRPFMFGIAINVLHKYLQRKYKRQRERDDFDELCLGESEGSSPTGILARKSETRLLVRALRRIPLKFQIVLELQFFEEMTGPEIAELLRIPSSTIYTYQRRGKERLHKLIAELAQDPKLVDSTMVGIQTWAEDVRAQITPSSRDFSGDRST